MIPCFRYMCFGIAGVTLFSALVCILWIAKYNRKRSGFTRKRIWRPSMSGNDGVTSDRLALTSNLLGINSEPGGGQGPFRIWSPPLSPENSDGKPAPATIHSKLVYEAGWTPRTAARDGAVKRMDTIEHYAAPHSPWEGAAIARQLNEHDLMEDGMEEHKGAGEGGMTPSDMRAGLGAVGAGYNYQSDSDEGGSLLEYQEYGSPHGSLNDSRGGSSVPSHRTAGLSSPLSPRRPVKDPGDLDLSPVPHALNSPSRHTILLEGSEDLLLDPSSPTAATLEEDMMFWDAGASESEQPERGGIAYGSPSKPSGSLRTPTAAPPFSASLPSPKLQQRRRPHLMRPRLTQKYAGKPSRHRGGSGFNASGWTSGGVTDDPGSASALSGDERGRGVRVMM